MTTQRETQLREALNAVYQDLGKWQLDKERAPVGPYAYHLMELALLAARAPGQPKIPPNSQPRT